MTSFIPNCQVTSRDIKTSTQNRKDMVFRGRHFTKDEIGLIKVIIEEKWKDGKSEISREICRKLNWYQDNGRLKDRACRDVINTLEAKGQIRLPPPKNKKSNKQYPSKLIVSRNTKTPIFSVVYEDIHYCFRDSVVMEMVRWGEKEQIWNTLVRSYHYQGFSFIVGRHLKYLIKTNGIPLACIAWGEAAWHLKDRDDWIGWSDEARRANLKLVVNNVRFLILPWVKIPNFASTLIARMLKVLQQDWYTYYGVKPLLAETFIDSERFRGTCYKAANWIHVGTTKGFARKGYSYYNHQTPKYIFIYPLVKDACDELQNVT